MNSSVTGVLKIFLVILILALVSIGLLGVAGVLDGEQTKDLITKSSTIIGGLGIASLLIAMLTASKPNGSSEEP